MDRLWRTNAVVDACRATACLSRLRILSMVATQGETSLASITDELGIAKSVTSEHIRRLVKAGLVKDLDWGREAKIDWSDAETFGAELATLLKNLLAAPETTMKKIPLKHRSKGWEDDPQGALHAVIFHLMTGFSNARRLKIYTCVADCGAMSPATIACELQIPPESAGWHLRKLAKREILACKRRKGGVTYRVPRRHASRVLGTFVKLIQRSA